MIKIWGYEIEDIYTDKEMGKIILEIARTTIRHHYVLCIGHRYNKQDMEQMFCEKIWGWLCENEEKIKNNEDWGPYLVGYSWKSYNNDLRNPWKEELIKEGYSENTIYIRRIKMERKEIRNMKLDEIRNMQKRIERVLPYIKDEKEKVELSALAIILQIEKEK